MKVAIVGCGVAGLSAAIALARKGCSVTAFDAFKTPRPVGSGLLLQPSGLAALRKLGLHEAVLDRGARIDRLDGLDLAGRRIMDMRYEAWRPGAFGVGVHRASLFQVLHDAARDAGVEIAPGTSIEGFQSLTPPVLAEAGGREHGPFDLAVIADGANSRLRRLVRPLARAPIYPWGAVWANAADVEGRYAGRLHQRYDRASMMAGILPIGRDSNGGTPQVSFFWSLPVADMDAFLAADLAPWRARVMQLWPEAGPVLAQLTPEAFSRAIYRDVSCGRWNRGAAVVIGDAAHGASPQLGQGANLALLDGVELGDRVDRPARITGYQMARRLQTGPYQLLSRLLTPLFQSQSRFWPWFRTRVFAPLSQAPVLRAHAAQVLAGAFRLGPTPRDLRP